MRKNAFLKIINNFGVKNQLKKLNEECYELIEAVNDYGDNRCDENRKHIVEEVADVLTIVFQIICFFNISLFEVIGLIKHKVKRTHKRMKEGYYNDRH